MSGHTDESGALSRHRFGIAGDGSTSGYETRDQLASALRYVCRMAVQIEVLLGVGGLHWLATWGSTAVTARIAQDGVGGLTVSAEVERRAVPTPRDLVPVRAKGTHATIRQCLQLVRSDFDADWCALVTGDKRIVGALLPDAGGEGGDVGAVLSDIGVRALAILGALDESYRETAVQFGYQQGSLIVVAVGDDLVLAFADKFDAAIAARTVAEVRALLAPHDLSSAWTWASQLSR